MVRKKKHPMALAKGHVENFETLRRACLAGDLALVSAVRKGDQAKVALVCAMQQNDDGTITPVPFAEMVNGNPFEMYEDPTV